MTASASGLLDALHSLLSLLREDFAGVELDKHGRVALQFFDGNGEAEVVEDEKLQLEMIQFY